LENYTRKYNKNELINQELAGICDLFAAPEKGFGLSKFHQMVGNTDFHCIAQWLLQQEEPLL
jgi:hypothetical protein